MEQTPRRPLTPFDEIASPAGLYLLKLLLPYAPKYRQRMFGIFLRFYELRYTVDFFFGFQGRKAPQSVADVLSDLTPYMSPEEQSQLSQMQSIMQMMELFRRADEPEENSENPGRESFPGQMFDAFSKMMNPKDLDLFRKYQDLFDEQLANTRKGDVTHGGMDEQPGAEGSRSDQAGNDENRP